MTLPSDVTLRRATSQDSWSIRRLVFGAKLDPTQLRWQQFWLLEKDNQIIACGQLRNFLNAQELGSLVVLKKWRNRGLGSHLTQHLITSATQPLYLECLGKNLEEFYQGFGFTLIAWQELPPALKKKFALSHFAHRFFKIPIFIMQYSSPNPQILTPES